MLYEINFIKYYYFIIINEYFINVPDPAFPYYLGLQCVRQRL